MNYVWPKQVKAAKALADLFTFELADSKLYGQLERAVIENSFFLPSELLNCGRYKISPLYVITGTELGELLFSVSSDVHFHSDIPMSAMIFAAGVGVSLRQKKNTGERFMVCKLWYGTNPFLSSDKNPLAALKADPLFHRFCFNTKKEMNL